MIERRPLGRSGLSTPALVLGGNVFGWTVDKSDGEAILDRFAERGGMMIDTADVYSAWVPGHQGGESESAIGDWLAKRGRRDDVLIATKVGMEMPDGEGLRPDRIRAGIEGSLKRLRTDYVDLYYAHRDDADGPQAEVLGAFDALVKEGKVRAIAASNYTPDRLAAALDISAQQGLARFEALQPLYNLMDRTDFEGGLQQLCIDREIGVLPYFSLASGFLTAKYRSSADVAGRPRERALSGYFDARGEAVLAALASLSAETGHSAAQLALAWNAAQPGVTAPIASATSLAQLDEIMGALSIRLTPAQLAALDEASLGAA